MGRPRKPADQKTGHYAAEVKEAQKTASKTAYGTRDVFSTIPEELETEVAKNEWKRIVKILKDMEIVGDIDVYSLIGYCNAWALYRRATSQLEKEPLIITTETGRTAKNPLFDLQDRAAKQLRDFAAKAGISLDARLKYAVIAVQKHDEEVKDEFGDI